MAQTVSESAREVAGATVDVKRVPETVPAEVFAASHGKADQAALIGKVGSVFTASATQHGGQGERQPSEQEQGMARFQGRHVAGIATKLFG